MHRNISRSYDEENTNRLSDTVAVNAGCELINVFTPVVAVHGASGRFNIFYTPLDSSNSLVIGPAMVLNKDLAKIIKVLPECIP
jgi:hypothetical protein